MEQDLAPAPSHKNRACRVWRKRVGFDSIQTKRTWSTPTMIVTKRPKGIHLGILAALLVSLTGCAAVERQPERTDFGISGSDGKPLVWVKPSGKVVYAPGKSKDEVVQFLVAGTNGQASQIQKLQQELAAAQAPKKEDPKPLLKDAAPAVNKAGKTMAELADESACKTDEDLAADPDTPEDIRELLVKDLKRCRTKLQDQALNRIADPSRTLEVMARALCQDPKGPLVETCRKAGL